MTQEESDLWKRILEFPIDDPDSSAPFSQRLASENGWSRDFALRAIVEYKRFLYLVVTSGHLCTPSDEVDQVWHLHLCYSRSYWQDLCRDCLGREVHHGPTKGGSEETIRYREAYAATLASYRAAFGSDADPEIWPPVERRFRTGQRFRRIDLARSWVVRRPDPITAGGLLLAGLALFFIACRENVAQSSTSDLWWLGLLALGVVIVILVKMGKRGGGGGGRNGRGGRSGSGCGTFGCGGGSNSSSGIDSGGGSGCSGGCGGGD